MVARTQLGAPSRLHHHRGRRLDDDRGATDPVARAQGGALEHRRREALRRLMRRPRGDHQHAIRRLERRVRGTRHHLQLRLLDQSHVADRLDRHLLDHEAAAFDHEPVAGAVLGLEAAPQLIRIPGRNLERGIGAAVADVNARRRGDPRRRQALPPEFALRLLLQFGDRDRSAGISASSSVASIARWRIARTSASPMP